MKIFLNEYEVFFIRNRIQHKLNSIFKYNPYLLGNEKEEIEFLQKLDRKLKNPERDSLLESYAVLSSEKNALKTSVNTLISAIEGHSCSDDGFGQSLLEALEDTKDLLKKL